MWKFLLFCLIFYVLLKVLRVALMRLLESQLRSAFPADFKFVPGKKYFSIRKFQGKSELMEAAIENLDLVFNIASVFGISKEPVFAFTVGKMIISLKSNDIKLPETSKKDSASESFESWTVKHFIVFLILEIFKRMRISFSCFVVNTPGYSMSIQEVLFLFKKAQKLMIFDFSVLNFVISQKEPLFRVPKLQFDVELNTYALKHLFSSLLLGFIFKIESTKIVMQDGLVKINIAPVIGSIAEDENVEMILSIHPIKAMIPSSSVHTKELSFETKDIVTSANGLSLGQVLVMKQEKEIIKIPSIKLNEADLVIPSVDIQLDISLILDCAMLISLAPHTPDDPFHPKPLNIPFNVVIDHMTAFFELSDMHKFFFDVANVRTSRVSNSVRFQKLDISPVVEGRKIRLLSATNFHVFILSMVEFHIKAKEVIADCSQEYAILQYLKATGLIMKYILKTLKGPKHVVPRNEPPTPFKVVFDSKRVQMAVLKKEISEAVTRSIEAKRIAMEGLCLRKDKAIKMLEAKGIKVINLQNFQNKSKEILWNLYKSIIEETEEEKRFCWADFTGFHLAMDGFLFKNFDEAIQAVCDIYPNTDKSSIGLLDGGSFEMTIDCADMVGGHFGTVGKFQNFSLKGVALVVPRNATKTHQIYELEIPCDNGSYELLIPDTTSDTAFMFKGEANSSKCEYHYSPAVDEMIEDLDFNIKDSFMSLFEYKNIKSFDNYRMLMHLLGSIKFDEFDITISNAIKPFTDKPLLNISLPKFSLEYNGEDFLIGFDSLSLFFTGDSKNQRIVKFPKLVSKCKYVSVNKINPDNNPPLFIDIDSSRVLDHHYDPYVSYRTAYYTLAWDLDFMASGEKAIINFDLFQPVIDEFYNTTSPRFSTFFDFARKSKYDFGLEKLSSNINFPQISLLMLNGTLNIVTSQFSSSINYVKGGIYDEATPTVSIQKLDATIASLGQSLGVFALKDFVLHQYEGNNKIEIDSITTDLQPELITKLLEVELKFPEEKKQDDTIIPEVIDENNINEFSKISTASSVTLKKMSVQLLDGSDFPPLINVDNFMFGKLVNEKKETINLLEFDQFSIFTSCFKNHPLIRSDNLRLNFAMNQKHLAVFLRADGSTEVCLRPADFDVIIPQLKIFMPAAMKPKLEKKSGSKMSMNLVVNIRHSLIINFMMNDDHILAMVMATGFNLKHVSDEDGTEDTNCSLAHLRITDETVKSPTDPFHVALRTNEKVEEQFSMKIQKRKKTMKCPVFNNIKFTLQPFRLNVSMKFIKAMTSFFPATLDLNIFDFDQTDLSEGKGHSNQIYIGGSGKEEDDDTEVVGFYRRVCVDEFVARMCYRGLPESIIKEILDRDFVFSKIEFTDLFGTKEQLKETIKHELKWNLIKAIPKLALKSK